MGTEETLRDTFGDMPYRKLVEAIRDFAVFQLDREGCILSWNAGAASVFGYDEAEAVGKHFAFLFTNEDQESGVPARELKEVVETGRAEDARWLQRKDDTRFYANCLMTALRDESGTLRGFAKVARDDTARRQGELALRASENRYRRLFEAAYDGILILNAETGRIADVNPFLCKLLDYPHPEFVGKELWEIGLFKDKGESQAAFQELQEKGYIRYENLPLETKAGVRREVEFISNVYREDGHHVIQCNIRDITERKRMEDEREQLFASTQAAQAVAEGANRLKDEFLATLSHELRTPLTAIIGWSDVLGNPKLTATASLRAVETIRRNAWIQVQMIDDLLDVSRIITGKLRMSVQPVDLGTIILAAVDGARPAAEAKGIRIQLQLDSPAGHVSGDPDRLQQVAWNLVSNAIKFTPKGG
ncbi:MAG TPA: PAS domain S-box protein, partial [Pyrinomonadaceae bacterium]|nr:PAS domain S-box protein [Pyrinomonadaceae bacterium]